ncbi:MAG: protein-L-isoaspartate(D-aspartate) O-methyltransferase [Candidatus Micrarchaeota archaeon]
MESIDKMIQALLGTDYADERVAEAMRKADRKLFVPPNYAPNAYEDRPLPIGFGQTISAPGVVAFMSKNLEVREGMKVLEIGAGSGWQAAILGILVGTKGEVWSVERVPGLVAMAKERIVRLGVGNVHVVEGDGTLGYPGQAPFDRIMVTAAGPKIPEPLLAQLKESGKLMMPVGNSFVQELVLAEKRNGAVDTNFMLSVVFVPLIGKHGYRE